jgi:aryl-alcohol dehydrogenase-like predicted oxidoreductase
MFEEIVGSSPALKTVLSNIMKVAPTRSERATDSARADDCSDCERSESLQGHRSWIGRCSEVLRKEKIAFIPWFPMAAGRVCSSDSPISRIAARSNATPSQVALAWLLVRSLVILPIPGTSKVKHLEENVAAAALEIDANTMGEWDGLTHPS